MERISYVTQGTDEWKRVKLAKVSCSHLHEVLAKGRGAGRSITRDKYMTRLQLERFMVEGLKPLEFEETFHSKSMDRGIIEEDAARDRYESENGWLVVEQVGFIHHATIPMFGASPDGLIGSDGMIEIKNRDSHNHKQRILMAVNDSEKQDRTAMLQTQGQMACADREWCDYVHFDRRFPWRAQYHVQRIYRDDKVIAEIEAGVRLFLEEMNAEYEAMLAYIGESGLKKAG